MDVFMNVIQTILLNAMEILYKNVKIAMLIHTLIGATKTTVLYQV